MKTNNKPALLDNTQQPKTHLVKIELSGGWAELRFSQKEMAASEYQRIRTQGVYGGRWITKIDLGEL